MSDKAEAAQKWAEAKVALDAADAALGAAKEAYAKAEDAEFHAWQALEELAGRVTATPIAEPALGAIGAFVDPTTIAMLHATGRSHMVDARGVVLPAHRHSLKTEPIG